MKNRLKNRLGMTLIEILVVVGMIGILSSIGVARYVSVRCKAKSDAQLNTIQEMKNKIDLARSLNGALPLPTEAFQPGTDGAKHLTDGTVLYTPNIAAFTYSIYFAEDSCLYAGQRAGANETEDAARFANWPTP